MCKARGHKVEARGHKVEARGHKVKAKFRRRLISAPNFD